MWHPRPILLASSADIAGDVTIGVVSLADPADVVAAGVASTEECGEGDVLLGDYVSEYEDFSYVGRYDDIYDVRYEDPPGYM